MAACKCRKCRANLTTANAYKIEIGKSKFYFCNEKHYKEYIEEKEQEKKQKEHNKELQDRFYSLFCEIIGVKGITNTALWKEKTEINKVFSDDVIVSYLEENKDWLTSAVNRLDGGEYGKIRYVSVILRNKLGDYKPVPKVIEPVVIKESSFEFFEPTVEVRHSCQKQVLYDVEDDLI